VYNAGVYLPGLFIRKVARLPKGITVLNLRQRIPTWQQITPVYGVIALVIYSWTILRFFWKLPSWLYYQSLGDIFSLYAYSAFVNLLESLVVLLAPLVLSIILPEKWFRNRFVARSTVMLLLGFSFLAYFDYHIPDMENYPRYLLNWAPYVAIAILILGYLSGLVRPIVKLAEGLAERTVIFLYITIPLSVISLFVVGIRNLV
jgi:hypothetical protein